jgi:tRNA modification GTPase
LSEIQSALSKNHVSETIRLLESLARYADVGRHLTTPWKVAVIGPPNVGKSSLVNALAGYQRSVVAPTPGTTRDLVTTAIAVDGWPVELIDTAGLRDETEILEGQGVSLARRAANEADLCLWILDASDPPVWPEDSLLENNKVRLIVNKIDLPAVWDIANRCHPFAAANHHDASPHHDSPRKHATPLRVSARTGAGLSELVEALAKGLVPDPPAAGAAVPFTPALACQIEAALTAIRAGRIEEMKQRLAALANQAR